MSARISSKPKRRRKPHKQRPSRRPNVWANSQEPLDLDAALRRAGREAPTPIVPGGPVVGWIVSAIGWFKLLPFWAKFLIGIAASSGLFYFAQLFRKPAFESSETRTYGFDAPRNTTGVGAAIPIVYGRHKVFGHIVQAFIETINDDQFYNILLCLSEGEINSISSIEINDQPVANFADVQTETRLGTAGQSKIPWFDDTRTTRNHGVALNNDAPGPGHQSTFTTVATNITAFVVALKFPSGLYTLDGNGNLKSNAVNVTIEYRTPAGSGAWTLLTTTDIREAKRNSFTRAFRKDNLTAGQYDIRVTRNSTEDVSSSSAFNMTYDTVDEITYGNTNFPNIALLGVRIRASEQLSGGLPPISCIVEGRKVRTRSGGAWTGEVYNRNPVWCVVDAITHTRYGMGNYIVDADLDIPALESAASTCDELVDDLASGTHVRHRLDMVLDQQGEAWDIVDRMLRTFRASIIESDNKYRLIIDKAGTVSQAFGNANMVRDSFVNGWVSLKEEFSQVEVIFFDEANDWIRETVRFPSSVGSPKLKTIELQGVTRRAHALREAKYHMNTVSALSRYIEFDAFLEGLAVEVGDVIEVSHDVPQWGWNGRVAAAVLNGADHDITVDRDDLPAPTAHSMLVRHDDDVVETRSVISKTGRVVKCAAFSKVPVARDSLFMYGPTNATSKKFRIMQMGLTKELRAHLVGIEYDEAIYDATGLVLPARSPSQLPIFTAPPGSVTNLTLVTQLIRNNQGIDTYRLQIHWNNPVFAVGAGQYSHAQIWLSTDAAGAHYQKIGEAVDAPFYTVVIPLATYFIKVVTVSTNNVAQGLGAAAGASLLVAGDVTGPGIPTGVSALGLHKRIELEWANPADIDYDRTEIWRATTNNRASSTKVAEVRGISWSDDGLTTGTQYFYWLRARDFTGNLGLFHTGDLAGTTATTATVTDADVDQVAPAQPGVITITTSTALNADGTIVAKVQFQWPHNGETDLAGYFCRIRITGLTWEQQFIRAAFNEAEFYGLISGASYSVELYAVDVFANYSAVRTNSFTAPTDTTVPASPTGFTATQGLGLAANLDWNDNTESDLAEYEVYRNTADNSGTATLIVKVRASRFIDGTVKEGTKYWYWLKARDFSGNLSAFSSSANIIPQLLDPWAGGAAFFDHFNFNESSGDDIDTSVWKVTKIGAGTIDTLDAHEVELKTGGTSGDNVEIRSKRGFFTNLSGVGKLVYEWRGRVPDDSPWADFTFQMGMWEAPRPSPGTLQAIVMKGTNADTIKFRTGSDSVNTNTDNIAIDPGVDHTYRVEIDSGNPPAAARLYVDDVLQATHTTNVSGGQYSFIGLIITSAAATKRMILDYAAYYGSRS